MLAVVTQLGAVFLQEAKKEPNPILPVWKEIGWAVGSFFVLLILMRYVAFPRVKGGMDARAAKIRGDLAAAEAASASLVTERQRYDAEIAAARAEASRIMDEARQEVEAARSEKLGAVNADLAQQKAAAASAQQAAYGEAVGSVKTVVHDLAVDAAQRVLRKPIDHAAQAPVVEQVLSEQAVRA